MEPGSVSHSIAPELIGFNGTSNGANLGATLPNLPSYQLRVGVAKPVDVGVRLSNLSSIGADVKVNPLRSKSFDLAIDPGIQYSSISIGEARISLTYIHLPVLLGFNLSENTTLVLTPGIMQSIIGGTVDSSDEKDSAFTSKGTWLRIGLGFNFRISKGFALHPEFTLLRPTAEGTSYVLYTAGLGLNFGSLPKYDKDE